MLVCMLCIHRPQTSDTRRRPEAGRQQRVFIYSRLANGRQIEPQLSEERKRSFRDGHLVGRRIERTLNVIGKQFQRVDTVGARLFELGGRKCALVGAKHSAAVSEGLERGIDAAEQVARAARQVGQMAFNSLGSFAELAF